MSVMDSLKSTKTYDRYSLKYKTQQSKLLSDLFDKVSQDTKGMPKLNCDTNPASHGEGNRRLQRAEPMEAVERSTGKEGVEMMESSPDRVGNPAASLSNSPCPLFESLCVEESFPKKSKPAVCKPRARGSKRGGPKSSLHLKIQKPVGRPSAATRPSTPVATSPLYPSIETFRNLRKQSFNWSLVHKETSLSCSQWLESMSDSFPAKELHQSSGELTERPCLRPRPSTPVGVRQHSFVKIRACLPLSSVKRPQAVCCEQEEGGESSEDDGNDDEENGDGVSSYTTVYTWTTDTEGGTNTALAGESLGKGGGQGKERASSSPTLVLKSRDRDPLHSTAVHPHHTPSHLQHTPHVSPIRTDPDLQGLHRTPSAPTHDVSPRGPRKTQSFASMRGHGVPPKCSTMLFASPMADAGDAPLDVSSIRKALSEAIDLNEDHDKERPVIREASQGKTGGVGDRVLTSTPCGEHSQFKWNLSSVELPQEDEDLLGMNSSHDTVNSEEIVADTLSESSILGSDDQGQEAEERVEEPTQRGGNGGAACSGQSRAESGVVLTSHTDHTDASVHAHRSSSRKSPVTDSSARHLSLHSDGTDQVRVEHGRSVHINSKGDGFEQNGKEFHSAGHQETPTTHRSLQRKTEGSSSSTQDEEMPPAQDSVGPGQVSVHLSNIRESPVGGFQKQQHQREGGGKEGEGDSVPPCPVSLMGDREEGARPNPHRPGLLLWVEPADSGFLDMVTSTPPDIVSVLSRKVKEGKELPLP
ncbi:uncharacterized protein LOC143296425 [Babylonia areolata]|uniref:uncharacterized protein LOC143296425 n=1 Tax=Babylonia areolata TaxID=304850 RepID=UPI003FD49E00